MKLSWLLAVLMLFHIETQAQQLELKVVTENWPPYIIKGDEPSGIVTEKINQILSYTNLNYSISVYPWARSYYIATNKPNVLIYSIYRNAKREPLFHWFCPIHQATPIRIYKLAGNPTDIDSIEGLKKSVLGIMRGDNSHNFFLQNGFVPGKNIDISASEEINLLKLVNGKVDAVVQSEESLRHRLNDMDAEHLTFIAGLVLHDGEKAQHCMALSKETEPEIIQAVQTAFDTWQLTQAN
ncbi:substrate-binding periplasmic protein [Thalassotalea euphylliae]|uniref:substrate-binding periplasmic protein n=1 Tax=Thalassotalea euphylliae TaxID=1655234 RepID=UPI003631266C